MYLHARSWQVFMMRDVSRDARCLTRCASGDLVCRVVAPVARPPSNQQRLQPQNNVAASVQVGVRIPSRVGSIGACFTQNKVNNWCYCYKSNNIRTHSAANQLHSSCSTLSSPMPPPTIAQLPSVICPQLSFQKTRS